MNGTSAALALSVAVATGALAQNPSPTVVERGPHHRIWQWTTVEQWPGGQRIERTHRVVELATGLHYWTGDGWAESRELIEPFPQGAVARFGPHRVIFAANLNSPGAIDLETPDGQRLASHLLGLAYTDTATGRSVLIAEVQDCLGRVVPPNQVWYRDAFKGLRADVRLTYRRAGLEQDVLLRQAPPPPSAYGLDPQTARLEVWTEFVEAPQPVQTLRLLRLESDPAKRRALALPDFTDEELDFGSMHIGPGEAFGQPADEQPAVPVGKSWLRIEGRQFLIEAVEYPAIQARLEALPQAAVPDAGQREEIQRTAGLGGVQPRLELLAGLKGPAARVDGAKGGEAMALAQAQPAEKAVVLDYQMLSGSLTNYVFAGDTTYYVSGLVYLYGPSNVLEGGTVIKYAPNASLSLASGANIRCQTSPYRPAILTARDDDSVGERAPGSTGSPSGYYASTALNLGCPYGTVFTLAHLRIGYAHNGLQVAYVSSTPCQVTNLQVLRCYNALGGYYGKFAVRNGLLWDNYFILNGSCASLVGEHLTIDSAYALCNGYYAWAYLTNCLLTAVGYTNGFSGLSNAVLSSASGVYQTVGGGRHYLAANSPYRNAGTTNINPGLAAELKRLTTYPPVVLTNCISVDTVLAPQAQRDTDTPDLGYHYAPIDFAVSGLQVTNATLVLSNDVAVGTFGSFGLWLNSGAHLVSYGQPHLRNHLCHYAGVQEQAGGWGDGSPIEHRTVVIWSLGAPPQVTVAFTDFDGLAGRGRHLCSDDGQWALGGLRAWDCAFHVGAVQLGGTETAVLAFTNSLWERAPVQMSSVATLHSQNNLFWQSALSLWGWGSGTSQFHDNAFVGCSLSSFFVSEPNQSHNAYIGMADRLTPTNGTEVITSQLGFQVGPLGRFYQPADSVLLNAGSRLASEVGLYHYTTTTNQVKETNSVVDIGLHYVAVTNVNGQWLPIDTDGDGWPDYCDPDSDADELPDGWELAHFGDLSQTAHDDPDRDGQSNQQEYWAGTDPNELDFRLEFPARYTASSIQTGAVAVLRGIPAQVAVLVDSTNWAEAVWTRFTTNPVAHLGSSEGWHSIQVGLRGCAPSSMSVWRAVRIKLLTSPPGLAITSPPPGLCVVPLLQIRGFSPRPLMAIRYDLTNAAGVWLDNMGYGLHTDFDVAAWESTTNYFELVDVELAPGTNWVGVRVTDLAGNVSSTNLVYVFDPSGDTNPPVAVIDWPTDGTELCGDVVFIKGRLDDATAAVYCQVVNSQGTNSYWGLVERNGTFWVQQVQVARGTNWVTLTFTDAATNQAVTHLTWVRGQVDLVIDTAALTAADLSRSHCTVRGTISHPDYAVWVNGVPATVAPDGSWVAEQVPTGQGGTAVFLTRVYPPGEHPQGPPSPPVNPASPNAKDNGAEQDRPARVRVQSYFEAASHELAWDDSTRQWTFHMQWAHQQPAEAFEWLFQTGPQGDESWWETWDFWFMYWPRDEYALPQPGEPQKWGVCYHDYWYHYPPNPPITGSETNPIGPPKTCATGDCYPLPTRGGPVLFWEQCHVQATRGQPPSQETWTRGACTRLILETGGKAHSKRPKRLSLFRLGWWNGPWHVTNAWYRDSYCPGETYEEPLDPQRVWVGELGRLGPDGYLYVPLPDNAQYDVTPRVIPAPEPYFYRFGNIQLCKLGLDLRAVTFHTVWAVLQDNGSGPYPTPHWTNDAHGQVVWSHPALYVSGDRVVTYTQFDVPGADPYANTFELVVRGQAVAGGLTKFNLWATNQPLSRHWMVTLVADAPLPADRVDFFNRLTIHWSYGVPGRAPFLPAGTSSNQVYVTLKPPITTNLFHTVVHLACANAVGQTDTEGTADAIYGGFAGRVVRRVHDNAQMTYWWNNQRGATETPDLLRRSDANGNCQAWSALLRDCFRVQGIAADRIRALPVADHSILVKNWHFNDPPSGTGRYPYVVGADAFDLPGIPGQGNPNPPGAFNGHWITLCNGAYYDPSYGTPKTTGVNKDKLYEDGSLDGYGNEQASRARRNDTLPGSSSELDYQSDN